MKYIIKHISSLDGKTILLEREDKGIEIVVQFRERPRSKSEIIDFLRKAFPAKSIEFVFPDEVWERYKLVRQYFKEGVTEE